MNYQVIILDCDGVVLDSNLIKSNAMRETVSDYGPDLADIFLAYHQENGGVSRYEKFDYFLRNIVGRYSQIEYEDLLLNLSERVKSALLEAPFTEGALEFIEKFSSNTKLFIVSGGDQEELCETFKARRIFHLFNAIYGSPTEKNTHCQRISRSLSSAEKVLFLGDSRLDHEVAINNNFDFIFISDYSEFSGWQNYCNQNSIKSFPTLSAIRQLYI